MHAVVQFWQAKSPHSAALRSALLMLAHASMENGAGCRQFDVCEDPLEPESFLVYALFADESAYRQHAETVRAKAFEAAVTTWVASRRTLTYDLISDAGQA